MLGIQKKRRKKYEINCNTIGTFNKLKQVIEAQVLSHIHVFGLHRAFLVDLETIEDVSRSKRPFSLKIKNKNRGFSLDFIDDWFVRN